jgi:hypothetical protein
MNLTIGIQTTKFTKRHERRSMMVSAISAEKCPPKSSITLENAAAAFQPFDEIRGTLTWTLETSSLNQAANWHFWNSLSLPENRLWSCQ